MDAYDRIIEKIQNVRKRKKDLQNQIEKLDDELFELRAEFNVLAVAVIKDKYAEVYKVGLKIDKLHKPNFIKKVIIEEIKGI